MLEFGCFNEIVVVVCFAVHDRSAVRISKLRALPVVAICCHRLRLMHVSALASLPLRKTLHDPYVLRPKSHFADSQRFN